MSDATKQDGDLNRGRLPWLYYKMIKRLDNGSKNLIMVASSSNQLGFGVRDLDDRLLLIPPHKYIYLDSISRIYIGSSSPKISLDDFVQLMWVFGEKTLRSIP